MDYRIDQLPPRLRLKIAVNPVSGCWEWTGSRNPAGLGLAWWEGRLQNAHRVVYCLLVEPLPDGVRVKRLRSRGCLSAACCWPFHLRAAAEPPMEDDGASLPQLTAEEVWRFYGKLLLGGCGVQWAGKVNNHGYGYFEIYRGGKRVRILAHRLAYKLAAGGDPGKSVVRHGCDVPVCCTPDCLLLGTQADNIRDAVERGRMNTTGLQDFRDTRDEQVERRIREGRKRCSHCKAVKEFSEFSRDGTAVDGRTYWCKACCADAKASRKKAAS